MKKLWAVTKEYVRSTDRWLLIMWTTASLASLLLLWGLYNSGLSLSSKIISQLMAVGMGMVAAIFISFFDYHVVVKFWRLYLPVCAVLVLLTYFVGTVRGSDQAWLIFDIAGRTFSLQPSELLKISFIVTFALHLGKVEDSLNTIKNMALLCFHGGAYIMAIVYQGDNGTALIFVMIFAIMLFCAGIQWRYVFAAAASMVVVLPLLWYKFLTDDHKMRFLTVYNPEISEAYAYQQARSIMAMGMGGLQGTGIFAGRHVQVPEVYNDFIFAFVGEACGFMGTLAVITLLTLIIFKLLFNSFMAKDILGRSICVGVFAMMMSQTVINLGMCLSLLPVIGVTLPLFSAGGTSVLSLYLGLGLVLSVYRHSSTGLFYSQ